MAGLNLSKAKNLLDDMNGSAQASRLGTLVVNGCDHLVATTYDFAVHGGATGDITLETSAIPAGVIVTDVFHEELTNLTSDGSATVQLKAGSTALTDAIAKTTFSGTKSEALASSATAIKISSASDLKVSIADAEVSAGKVRFYVKYFVAEDTL